MPKNIVGKCPICQMNLSHKGEFVECQNKDYKAEFSAWDKIWLSYDVENDSADDLLSDLLSLNLIMESA